jgi:hypothetical protein
MIDKDELFKKIDKIREIVDATKAGPKFYNEVNLRKNRSNDILDDKNKLFHRAGEVLLFGGVPADRIEALIKSGVPKRVFKDWKVSEVAEMDADSWLDANWKKTSTKKRTPLTEDGKKMATIWLPQKIIGIIGVAKIMSRPEWPTSLFKEIPHEFQMNEEIPVFWTKVDALLDKLKELGVPYYKSQTSLLHLLLDLGYPCLKPDSVVMDEAKKFGIVEPHTYTNNKGKVIESYRDEQRRSAVTFFQEYCISRQIKPAMLDLYLLIDGDQTGARQYVK